MSKLLMNSRVALREGADTVYVYALAGTEGWVRDEKTDDDGFELVRIEWDKDHWRYNGQPDGWSYADHFYVIGPPVPPKEQPKGEGVEQELDTPDSPEVPIILPQPPASDSEADRYMETLTEAIDAGSEAEAFFMLTVRRMQNPENPEEMVYVPSIFNDATSTEAAMLIDIQLAECASTNYQDMIFNLMEAMKNDRS